MGTQVPPSKRTLSPEDKPAPPPKEVEKPEDYKQTFRVSISGWDTKAKWGQADLVSGQKCS